MTPAKRINIALVGLGFGAEFIPIYQRHPNANLAAICQRDEQKLNQIGDAFKVEKRYRSYEELLADPAIDAVHINTPIPDHARQSLMALEAGKHVACTVPMATTVDECRQIVELAARKNRKYMMMETVVYAREFLFVRELYQKGELGKVQFVQASHQQDMDGWPGYWPGLPPMHYATHCVGPCLALTRATAEYVSCFGSGRVREELIPKYGSPFAIESAHVKFRDSDVTARIYRSLFDVARQYRESFDVYGSKQTFEWPLVEGEQPILHTAKKPEHEIPAPVAIPDYAHLLPEGIRQFTTKGVYDLAENTHLSFAQGGGHGGSHPHLVHAFLTSLVEDREPFPNAAESANWTCVGILAHESAMKGGEIIRLPEFTYPKRAESLDMLDDLRVLALALALVPGVAQAGTPPESRPIRVLFLGDNGHHEPAKRAAVLVPALARHGIEVVYTDKLDDLNPKTLAKYDCLLVYANSTSMSPEQEQAMLDYVESGHGFVPLHCASFCFAKHPKYVALVGGHFQKHGTGVFQPRVVQPDHPLLRGFKPYEVWDETYVHDQLADDRTVLMVRDEGGRYEPWTWIRQQGKGRVFYTASGHDDRCWRNTGFLDLVERGIRWSVGQDPTAGADEDTSTAGGFPIPAMTPKATDAKPFEYVPARVAFYPPNGERRGDGSWNKMQKPLSPQESMKHLSVPEGFALELFAAEPEIGKPITMAWDERGRLWLCETVDYPNEKQPEGQGRDRIRICEDTDGDGRADKFTVFAEKLSIPTSLCFSQGGVIVHQAPDTLFLKDTNGDDVADERRVLFTGWKTHDTHAGPSNLQYGLDNWIWGQVGYAGFEGTVGGEQHKFNQGFYRFKPDGSKLEFLRSTNNNTWGLGFSEEGFIFGSTANHNPSVYLPIPNRYYEAVRGWSSSVLGTIADTYLFHAPTEKIRQVDHHGGYTAAAGHALYTARSYPREYWNRTAFVAEPTGHLVGVFVLEPDGADFHSTNPFNLIEGDDEWFAPIMAEVGPDGQVWIIDWYNYIVQHNPTPVGFENGPGNAYVTNLRDKQHGRIYRVVYKGAKTAEQLDLSKATPDQLVATLKNPSMFWRKHAQRLLVERGAAKAWPELVKLLEDQSVDDIGLNVGAIHALRTLDGGGLMDELFPQGQLLPHAVAAFDALGHPSAAVRRNAVAVLPPIVFSRDVILRAKLLEDSDAQLRLATLLALAGMPAGAEAGEAVARAVLKPENFTDRWIPDAATAAASANDVHFLIALAKLSPLTKDQPVPERVLNLSTIVASHYARGGPIDTVSGFLVSLATAPPWLAEAVVNGLARGWPKLKSVKLSAEAQAASVELFKRLPAAAQGQLINLQARLGDSGLDKYAAEITDSLIAKAADATVDDTQRVAAAHQVIEFRSKDAAVAEKLLALISVRSSSDLAAGIIDALARSDNPSLGADLVAKAAELPPTARAAVYRALMSRGDWTAALLDGLQSRQLQIGELSLDQKQALAAHPNKKLAMRARKLLAGGGALPDPNRQKVIDELQSLTTTTGDAAHGKEVFVKQCSKCHTHSGVGNRVGPDLTGMAVHPKAELLTHILDPSRSVEGNYRAYTVLTADGRVLTGLLASETRTTIELVDSEGKRQTIERETIEQLVASPKSIMPEGFEKQVRPAELVDLLEFLTTKGRYLPLPLGKAATVVTTKNMFHEGGRGADRIVFDDWGPKQVAGVPFLLIDPLGGSIPNAVLLNGPFGTLPPKMPRSVKLPINSSAKAIHLLSGVSGWGYPASPKNTVSMIVRLHYADGATEDHRLVNGEHFADYIRRVDVPGSEWAMNVRDQQLRYLTIRPKLLSPIRELEFIKGDDKTAPLVMAATLETP